MKRLQTALERILDELPQDLLSGLLAEKLAEQGVELSDAELARGDVHGGRTIGTNVDAVVRLLRRAP